MKLVQRVSQILLVSFLTVIIAVSSVGASFASSLQTEARGVYIADNSVNLGNTVKGNLKKTEGKVQETYGNLTGDRDTQVEGKAKQAEGEIRLTQPGSESEIEGKAKQAENNIYRYQSREKKEDKLTEAVD
ncbi:CsbD family protein [Calothrix sp. NIES-4071]|nr:CsbD family protein [Calothrix sp. NIES-4071]BAZ54853.1 CsbD family protein [Calothrix sp. NIES-4105]